MVEIDFFGIGQIHAAPFQVTQPISQTHLLEILSQPGWNFFVTHCETESGFLAWDIHASCAALPRSSEQDHEILNLLEAKVYSAQSQKLFSPPRRLLAQEVIQLRSRLAQMPNAGARFAEASYWTTQAKYTIQTWRILSGFQEANA